MDNPKAYHEEQGQKGRFVLRTDDGREAGHMTYVRAGESRIIIDHTETSADFAGRGLGRVLVEAGVAFAREQGLKMLPLCPFAKKVFDKTPEFADVRD